MNILSQKTLLLILFLAALSFFGGWLFFRGQNETAEEMNQSGIERSSPVLSENVERKEVMSDESEMIDEKRGEEKLGGLFRRVDTIGWSLYEDPEFSFKYPSSYSIRKIRDGLLVFGTEERVSSSFLPRSSSIVEKGFSLSIERTLLGDDGSGKSDVLLLREWSGGDRGALGDSVFEEGTYHGNAIIFSRQEGKGTIFSAPHRQETYSFFDKRTRSFFEISLLATAREFNSFEYILRGVVSTLEWKK